MKVTLISPYEDISIFGVRSLSATLKSNNHKTQIIFLRNHFSHVHKDKIVDEIIDLARISDLIGISLTTNYFYTAVSITEKIKNKIRVPIIWGGIHPTVCPEECLRYADYICVGEGEDGIKEFVKGMETGSDLNNVEGIWANRNNSLMKKRIIPFVRDLDSLPFADYDYTDHYVVHDGHINKMNESLLAKYIGWRGVYSTMATRGCPFGCTYCFNNVYLKTLDKQKYTRRRSVDNLIKELAGIKNRFSFIKRIAFEDDAFFVYSEEEIEQFSDQYKKYVGLPFQVGGMSPTIFSERKLSLLVDAGLELIRLGVQTGSNRTKKIYKRYYSNERVETIANTMGKARDKTDIRYDFILDNPWESDEDIIDSLMLITKFPTPYRLNLFSLSLYPGTELYEKAIKEGILARDKHAIYQKTFQVNNKIYLNKIFLLIKLYAPRGIRISPTCMRLLTNNYLRQFGIAWILYCLLKTYGVVIFIIYLMRESLKDIKKGNWCRIINYRKGP